MAVSAEDIARVTDLFEGVPDLRTRAMFGGLAIYSGDTIFAMIGPDDRILLKAKGALAEELEALGSRQFVYDGHKNQKPTGMPYWDLPDAALDDPELAAGWARRALDAQG